MKKQIDNTFTEIPKILLNLISKVIVNDKEYNSIKEWSIHARKGENILLLSPTFNTKLKIIVKESALHDSPFFQFHKQHNNNVPIPLTEMYGIKIDERDKTVKMDLWDKEHKIHWVGWLVKSWILEESKI